MVDVATMLGAQERTAQADMEKALAFETKLAQVGEFRGEVDSFGCSSQMWMWMESWLTPTSMYEIRFIQTSQVSARQLPNLRRLRVQLK